MTRPSPGMPRPEDAVVTVCRDVLEPGKQQTWQLVPRSVDATNLTGPPISAWLNIPASTSTRMEEELS